MVKVKTFGLCYLLLLISAMAAARSSKTVGDGCGYRLVGIKAERLPDLNIPRSHHAILNVGGEVVVIGGHTDNFIPTPTAEYFKDGRWHTIPMSYIHDGATTTTLSSGKVLVAGGFEKEMGIGQSWGVELYDPEEHRFKGIASLDRKRALASATEIDGGRVVIAGNWYGDDAIEVFDGDHTFSHAKTVSQGRSTPYVLRIAKDNVVVFGSVDTKSKPIDASKVDYLHGDARNIPLLERWTPSYFDIPFDCAASFIGNVSKEEFTYLLPVLSGNNWKKNVEPQKDSIAIAMVHNGEFSLLPTTCPMPMMSEWGPISYYRSILADQKRQKAYMIGFQDIWKEIPTKPVRLFVLAIDYAQKPAALTLYYTEPLEDVDICYSVLTADGNLMLAGGLLYSNFEPSSSVWLIHVNPQADALHAHSQARWLWWVLALLVAATLLYLYYIYARRRPTMRSSVEDAVTAMPTEGESAAVDTLPPADEMQQLMMEKVCRMMEEEQLYLNSKLKVQHVAERLGTNRTYLSGCINTVKGYSFTQLVNAYRVEHAQRLLRQQPDMKIVTVAYSSGFGSEMSFFRAFKSVTGTSPKEWKNNTHPSTPNI